MGVGTTIPAGLLSHTIVQVAAPNDKRGTDTQVQLDVKQLFHESIRKTSSPLESLNFLWQLNKACLIRKFWLGFIFSRWNGVRRSFQVQRTKTDATTQLHFSHNHYPLLDPRAACPLWMNMIRHVLGDIRRSTHLVGLNTKHIKLQSLVQRRVYHIHFKSLVHS